MIEHERSYVFSWEGGKEVARRLGSLDLKNEEPLHIEDYYLGPGFRLRSVAGEYIITRKVGDKSKGYRVEEEATVCEQAAHILMPSSKLTVKKNRYKIQTSRDEYEVTLDFIQEPMNLAILEIEAHSQIVYPVPGDILMKLFGLDFKECPLCSWSLFKRKIGICGGPSSGKTETSKKLSFDINTAFKGNSFHIAEFATTFIQKYDRVPEFYDQFFVWFGQRQREHDGDRSNIVISDCPTFLAYVYMMLQNKSELCSATAMYMSKIYKRVLHDLLSYTDLIFLKLGEYNENNVRYQTPAEAHDIENRIHAFLRDHNISHIEATYHDQSALLGRLFYINDVD